ncbi:hypothetical protein ACFPRL_24120 [Pseudoclavibacter helvolus]
MSSPKSCTCSTSSSSTSPLGPCAKACCSTTSTACRGSAHGRAPSSACRISGWVPHLGMGCNPSRDEEPIPKQRCRARAQRLAPLSRTQPSSAADAAHASGSASP